MDPVEVHQTQCERLRIIFQYLGNYYKAAMPLKAASPLKIRRQAVFFPIAVTGWLKAAAAVGFFRQISWQLGPLALPFRAARCSFSQRAFGGRGQSGLFAGLVRRSFPGGLRCRLGWHGL